MSNRLVCEPAMGIPFVIGLGCSRYKWTASGQEDVKRNWGKDCIELETLKLTSRII